MISNSQPEKELNSDQDNSDSEIRQNLILYASCEELRARFLDLTTSRDIAKLLVVPYESLVYRLYKVPEINRYKKFALLKKSGGIRTISAPQGSLKIMQRKLSQVLYSVYIPKPSVHGFTPEKSIVSNAIAHTKKKFVLNIDLKDFFPSINFGRVRGMFMANPYNLGSEVATVLAQICCYDNQLPQGAPTSPIVSNMICAKLDSQLQRLAKEHRCTYTRYADDITLSTTLPNFPASLAFPVLEEKKVKLGNLLISIIEANGFKLNEKKIRLQSRRERQEVTGLTVNDFPNISRQFIRQVSAMLHAWEKFGLQAVEQRYRENYAKYPTRPSKEVSPFVEVLHGKINFIGMVKGKEHPTYKKYSSQYRNLFNEAP